MIALIFFLTTAVSFLLVSAYLYFNPKIVEKEVEIIRYVPGYMLDSFLFKVEVFDKEKYEKESDPYERMHRYMREYKTSHYFLSCKDAFQAFPNSPVTKVAAFKIDDKWFIGDVRHVSIHGQSDNSSNSKI